MLAAHADLEALLGGPTTLYAHAHELTDATLIDGLERVAFEQALLEICRHHAALHIVAAETERHLREVVGSEAEEVGLLGDLVGTNGCPRCFDHRANGDVGLVLHALDGGVDFGLHPAASECKLFPSDRERDHHLDDGVLALLAK